MIKQRFGLIALSIIAAASMSSASETPDEAAFRIAKNGEVVFRNYPPRALAAGEQGVVGFALTLDKRGEPTECRVTHTSGHKLLDNETCALIVNTGVFKPVRDGNGNLIRKFQTEGFVSWQIPGREKVLKVTEIAPSEAPDKIICKRMERTGSLIARERVCRTAREWARTAAEQKGFVEELQGMKGYSAPPQDASLSCPSGDC